ncbi:MAG: hypothetical protein GY866_17455 [Proteobacteria bacterium]|nr:hypothetical protein [Pseudomonadota bacterium]
MEISLELQGYCIETASKKRYERLLRSYFDKSTPKLDRPFLEDRIEGLRFFIENVDFGDLRSHHDELDGNRNLTATLRIPENPYETTIHVENETIAPKWKSQP